jgi:transcriptional regulator GlxA family with amidase domain
MFQVTTLFIEGSHASTAVGPLEVFRAAGRLWNQITGTPEAPAFSVRAASIDGRAMRADGPYRIQPDEALDAVGPTDLVFVPSVGLDLDAALARNRPIIDFLVEARAGGAEIAGVCTGVSLLAEAGLLDGRIATTHWGVVDTYRDRFPTVDWRPENVLTEDEGIYCGGGVYAALDLALYLVEKRCSREIALECARSLLIEMPRDCQAGFAVLPIGKRHADDSIRAAEDWIRQHCREEVRFETLASQLGMSPRNFIRRFKAATGIAPIDYLQRLRVRAARRLLEEGDASVQEVGLRVGYSDPAFFRDLFKRHTGLAPLAYKKKFSA